MSLPFHNKLLNCHIVKLLNQKKQYKRACFSQARNNNVTISAASFAVPDISEERLWHLPRRPADIKQCSNGFTLIELLTVIAIIGILMAVATVSFTNAQQKGRDGKRKADLKSIQQALELYYQVNGQYPGWDAWCAEISHSFWTQVKLALEPTYIQKVPTDPLYANQARDYLYYKLSSTRYQLSSILENSRDPERGTYSYPCSGYSYNYQVINP